MKGLCLWVSVVISVSIVDFYFGHVAAWAANGMWLTCGIGYLIGLTHKTKDTPHG